MGRKGKNCNNDLLIALNMTPVPRVAYRVGVPRSGKLKEIFNSDKPVYFGTGEYENNIQSTQNEPWQFRDQSVEVTIPPLGAVVFKYV